LNPHVSEDDLAHYSPASSSLGEVSGGLPVRLVRDRRAC